MDKELFELCKQVYEVTGWGRMDNASSTDEYYVASWTTIGLRGEPDVVNKWRIARWADFQESGRLHYALNKQQAYPLYTSDYLLEKLPARLEVGYLNMSIQADTWIGGYIEGDNIAYDTCAATPLKALLKLTLALNEQGLLDKSAE